jgi:hypothetical protein
VTSSFKGTAGLCAITFHLIVALKPTLSSLIIDFSDFEISFCTH